MVHARRLFGLLALFTLASPFVGHAHASTLSYNGKFSADDTVVTIPFSTSLSQIYNLSTTSFAGGGFVPVLTLFSAAGGDPLAFAETDMSDVSIDQLLGPGSYLLALTEDPNVFTTTFAAGTLYAGMPNATGDTCSVAGGQFLDAFDGCTQRTSNYAVTISSTAATPEPASWLLVTPATALLFVALYRRETA